MNTPVPRDAEVTPPGRWQLMGDVIAFQFKLMLDGLRDLLLSPISIGAALLGLFTDATDPGKYFYRLMAIGRKSDHWINLFNSYGSPESSVPTADQMVKRAEQAVRSEYEKGGLLKDVKDGADDALDRLQGRGQSNPDSSSDGV